MAEKASERISRKLNEGKKAARKIESDVDRAFGEAKRDVKKAAVSTSKAVKVTAQATAKNVKQGARTAKTVTKAIVADVKKDVALATKPNDTWTVSQLKEAARKKSVTGYSSMTKAELLAALGAR